MNAEANRPLAERMRPKNLNDYIGQTQILGQGASLRIALEANMIPSMILWGPPGVGKTTLAYILAETLGRTIFTLSAISSGVKDVREIIQKAEQPGIFSKGTPILFIDEIHRFSKSQQDSLLGAVEKGTVTLIGATTENPSFEVISALLSRCQVYVLKHHTKAELTALLERAIQEDEILSSKNIILKETDVLLAISGGDARKLLNLFEIVVNVYQGKETIEITDELVKRVSQKSIANYDKNGEQHYDIISAFIKSIRGSDPNGAIYWLARMIEGGEDPKFIARRLLISASEDIGLANPNALLLANATFDAVERIGWPESRIILAECTVFLATSPKGNASYKAIGEAQALVKATGDLAIPLHLRNAPTKLMKELDYGLDYKYAHDFPGNFVEQEYLPDALKGHNFFHPGSSKKEQEIQHFIEHHWKSKYQK